MTRNQQYFIEDYHQARAQPDGMFHFTQMALLIAMPDKAPRLAEVLLQWLDGKSTPALRSAWRAIQTQDYKTYFAHQRTMKAFTDDGDNDAEHWCLHEATYQLLTFVYDQSPAAMVLFVYWMCEAVGAGETEDILNEVKL